MKLFRRNKQEDAKPKTQTTTILQEQSGRLFLSALCSTYENVFPQVRPLVDELKQVVPYGVGRNGARKSLLETPELAALEWPNSEMGRIEFMDLAFSMWLTERQLNIHVWKKRNGRIAGYTILPPNCRVNNGNGDYYFQVTTGNGGTMNLSKDEVMTLRYSRNPASLDMGVSPAQTVFVQTQISDLLFQYERAFLENGAVPAYITFIRASTEEKFLNTKKEMEASFKGADNRGKTAYIWREFLPATGQDLDQVEIKTIQPNNSTLAIKELISIVKDDFNKAFGVSEFILGNDSSAKYDNAELSQRQFLEHRVKPALVAFWSQFQHELDRIFGGIGYSIQFDLEIPELTERMKVKAETKKIETETRKIEDERKKVVTEQRQLQLESLKDMISSGVSAEAAIKALELGDEWRAVAEELVKAKADIGQVSDISTPDGSGLSGQIPDKIHSHCSHHTTDAGGDPITFTATEVREKAIYDELIILLQNIINEFIDEEIVLREDEIKEILDEMLEELAKEAGFGANDAATQIQSYLYGKDKEEIEATLENGGFKLSDEFYEKMQSRIKDVVNNLSEDVRGDARKVLAEGKSKSANEIERDLAKIIPRERAALIARNEVVHAFRSASYENAQNLAKQYGLKMKKIWHCHDGACPICQALDGTEVELDEKFPEHIEGQDGVDYSYTQDKWNDNGETASAHPRCRCYAEYKVVRDE